MRPEIDHVLALAIHVPALDTITVSDDDRDAIDRLREATIPVVVVGPPERRADLQRYARDLGIETIVEQPHGDFGSDAILSLAEQLRVFPDALYVVVTTASQEIAVRDAGAIPLLLGAENLRTIRDAVAHLAGPILRVALKIRGVIADLGVDS